MSDKYFHKYTIPNIIKKLNEAEDLETISYYENILVSMYLTVLLYLAGIANLVIRYQIQSENLDNCIFDTLFFFSLGLAFDIITRVDLKPNLVTQIVSGLSCVTFSFIMIRFYEIIGPAVWTVAFLLFMLAMIRITKIMLYSLIATYLISIIYLFYHSLLGRLFRMNSLYNVIQIVLFIIICIISAAAHKIHRDRYYKKDKYLQKVLAKKDKVTVLYKQIAASEKEIKATLEKLKRTQEQLIQQEKLAAIGQLAAGVAHEINNPLGYVSSNCETSRGYFNYYKNILQKYQMLIDDLPQVSAEEINKKVQEIIKMEDRNKLDFITSDQEELFNDIEDGLKRISEIVKGLKTFSRIEKKDQFEDYNLNNSIKKTLLIARNEVKYHARVVELLGDIPIIQAKGSQINQVLLNIILNAAYAVKENKKEQIGIIMVSTARVDSYVRCQIEDNGIGIEKKYIRKIFDPFFTMKPLGCGTGLGLSIAYDIVVNKHGGEISVQSEPGVSTKFIIKLPVKQLELESGEKNE